MKRYVMLLIVFTVGACHHSMEPWPSESDRQEVTMYVRTRSLSGIPPSPSAYQFFIYDKEKNKVSQFNVNPEVNNPNLLHIKLFPGSYTAYCTTNAEEAETWEYSDNLPPEQIYLKSQKTKGGHEEARDYLLGSHEITVGENIENSAIFDLNRKVGMLKVIIENIPDWLTDLQINLDNIPQKMSLTGEYSGNYTVSKNITIPDETGSSETNILVFPPAEKALLTLSSTSFVYISPEHIINSILPNRITEIKAIFQTPAEGLQFDITSRLVDWEEEVINETDWEIDMPEGVCTGNGDGHNLVANPGFEEEFENDAPIHWVLDASDKTNPKTALSVNTPVQEGSKAVLIEGKTYLYQDIPILGGQCYQLHLYVNAPNSDAKWKFWGTWMKGSTNFTPESTQLRSETYERQTNGYIDVYHGKVFRAPANANKLRLEVRNYNDPVSGQGIYIDNVSVETVN